MAHILAVGLDTALLTTRGLVLLRTGADVLTCGPEHALKLLQTNFFDIVVLCHTLPEDDLDRICRTLARSRPKTRIIFIGGPVSNTRERWECPDESVAILPPSPARLLDFSLHLLHDSGDGLHTGSSMMPA